MIRIRTFHGEQPLPRLDATTVSNRAAAQEARHRASHYGWEDVQVNFGDGSRPIRGEELREWADWHFPSATSQREETEMPTTLEITNAANAIADRAQKIAELEYIEKYRGRIGSAAKARAMDRRRTELFQELWPDGWPDA